MKLHHCSDQTFKTLLEVLKDDNVQQPEPEATRVFTDDLAPIEWVTNKIVIDFFLEGNWEDLR